jgi:hypothetical protein
VSIVELNAELEVLLHDVLDRNWRLDDDAACVRILSEQRRNLPLYCLLRKEGN